MAERKVEIKIVADTSDFKKTIEEGVKTGGKLVQSELEKQQVEAAKVRRSAARTEVLAAGAGGALLGGQIYARQKGLIASRSLRQIFTRGAVMGFARFLGPVGAALGAAIGGSMLLGGLRRRTGGGATGTGDTRQTTNQILLDILAQSSRQSKSLNQIAVEAQARLDPLGRGPAFQRSRMAALNANIRPDAANLAFRQAEARAELDLVNASRARRSQGGIMSEAGIALTQGRTLYGRGRLAISDQIRRDVSELASQAVFALSGSAIFGRQARGRQEARGILDFGENEIVPAGGGRGEAFRSLFSGSFFDPASERGTLPGGIARRNAAQAMRRRRGLMAMQIRGPGNMLAPAPTVRAGEESEYRFRVAQQRRGLQAEASVEYLKGIKRVLDAMYEKGEATSEQLEAVEVRQNVGKYIQGVN